MNIFSNASKTFSNLKNMLRILYDDFDQKVNNIHDEMDLHHSYKKRASTKNEMLCDYTTLCFVFF